MPLTSGEQSGVVCASLTAQTTIRTVLPSMRFFLLLVEQLPLPWTSHVTCLSPVAGS
jgi:hypothetical protein